MPPVPSSSRRPPLLPTTPISELPPPTPRPGHVAAVTPSALSNMASSSRPTPLPQSPGLVTYQPPEELEAAAAGYFDQQPPDRLANQRAGERDNAPLPDANNGLNPNVAQILEEARREVERRAAAAALDDPIRQIQIVPEPPEDDVGAAAGDDNAGLDVDFVDGADDDMDGAMEAIGIRGPVHAVVQNVSMLLHSIGNLGSDSFNLGCDYDDDSRCCNFPRVVASLHNWQDRCINHASTEARTLASECSYQGSPLDHGSFC
ncbi:hypothetical protein FRC03_005680 [Tulasnella sp. 419]|nr:hypothetical protein FRC03_005680 [Tulasnella sp. 419]